VKENPAVARANRPDESTMSWVRQPWLAYFLCGFVGLILYRLAPALGLPDGVRTGLYWLNSGASAGALFVGARLYRPGSRWAWFLGAGQLAALGADITFYGANLAGITLPYPSGADLLYLLQYPLTGIGLFLIIRRRTPGWDLASLLDAGIITVAAGLLSWMYLVIPAASGDGLTVTGRLISAGYPLGDLLLLALGARLLLGAGERPFALKALAAYLALVIVPDALYGLQSLAGTYHEGGSLETLWMSAALLLGVTGLHPSMREVDARSPVAAPDASPGRLLVLAAASLVAPAVLLVQYLRAAPLFVPLICGVCAVLFLLVLARMAGLIAIQRHMAITDGLTGLRTRRYFEHALSDADRSAGPVGPAVILLDIDFFKAVNDTYGHGGGDRVLCEVSRRISTAVRPGDLVARYGGEEFAVILPNTSPADARQVAERVHQAVRRAPIAVGPTAAITVTASLGVASMPDAADSTADLILLADQLLYTAKETGRDRVAAPELGRGPAMTAA
jgi:diguanylate cyclase (GGDEF)-like protein